MQSTIIIIHKKNKIMEKQLKKAVVEQLEYDIDRGNYGMFSTKKNIIRLF